MESGKVIKVVRYSWWTVEWYESYGANPKVRHCHWHKQSTGFFAKGWKHANEIFNKKTGYMQDYFSARIVNVKFTN